MYLPLQLVRMFTIVFSDEGGGEVYYHQIDNGSYDDASDITFDLDSDFAFSPWSQSYYASYDNIGVNPVNLIVEDEAGNTSSCPLDITVKVMPNGWAHYSLDGCPPPVPDYDEATGTFSITAEGCYSSAYYRPNDPQPVFYNSECSDSEIIAEITNLQGQGWAGIFISQPRDESSKMIQLLINGAGLARLEFRSSEGGTAYANTFQSFGKNWMKMTRNGNQVTAYLSADGQNWDLVFTSVLQLSTCAYYGFSAMNATPTGTFSADFENVSVNSIGALAMPDNEAPIPQVSFEQEPSISVYPNPATEEAFVDLSAFTGKKVQLSLLNINGQVVRNFPIEAVQHPTQVLNLDGLREGTYLVRMVSGQEQSTTKLVILGY